MTCASKFNETRTTRNSQTAIIAIALPFVGVGVALISVLIIIGVVLFVYCRRRKEKHEEADHTDMESDTDIRPQCKSHYHPVNHDLSNSQMAISFRRTCTVSYETLLVKSIYGKNFNLFIHYSLLIQMSTLSVLHLLVEFVSL